MRYRQIPTEYSDMVIEYENGECAVCDGYHMTSKWSEQKRLYNLEEDRRQEAALHKLLTLRSKS